MRAARLFFPLLLLGACGPSLPTPAVGDHLGDTPIAVPIAPPPGKAEVIPPRPADLKQPVWIDGEWEWTGRRWQWKNGRWEEAPRGQVFAPAILVRRNDGSFAYFPGAWKAAAGGK